MKTTLAALMLALPLFALAQSPTLWRCGPDGRSYSDQPCSQGTAIAGLAPRPAADVQSARERALADRKLADGLTQARLRDEAAQRGNGLGGIKAEVTPVKTPTRPSPKHHSKKTKPPAAADTWQATAPGSRRKKG